MKKKWSSMSYEEKILSLTQCIEAGYVDDECLVDSLMIDYHNDPCWFNFTIESDSDWDDMRSICGTNF